LNHAVVIGGGAAGMLCAILLAEKGNKVTLIEHNDRLGKKLFITGKGRCNFTNDCTGEEFLNHVVSNPKFLFSALSEMDSRDTIRLFESFGMAVLKWNGAGRSLS
jgi:predicted flavoprotein YhiN